MGVDESLNRCSERPFLSSLDPRRISISNIQQPSHLPFLQSTVYFDRTPFLYLFSQLFIHHPFPNSTIQMNHITEVNHRGGFRLNHLLSHHPQQPFRRKPKPQRSQSRETNQSKQRTELCPGDRKVLIFGGLVPARTNLPNESHNKERSRRDLQMNRKRMLSLTAPTCRESTIARRVNENSMTTSKIAQFEPCFSSTRHTMPTSNSSGQHISVATSVRKAYQNPLQKHPSNILHTTGGELFLHPTQCHTKNLSISSRCP